jgi:hypothetical protein
MMAIHAKMGPFSSWHVLGLLIEKTAPRYGIVFIFWPKIVLQQVERLS